MPGDFPVVRAGAKHADRLSQLNGMLASDTSITREDKVVGRRFALFLDGRFLRCAARCCGRFFVSVFHGAVRHERTRKAQKHGAHFTLVRRRYARQDNLRASFFSAHIYNVKPRPKVGRQRGRGKSKPDFEKILGESHRPMISRQRKSGESSAVRALGIPRRLPPSRAVDFSATKIRRILGCSASWLIKLFLGEVLPRRAVVPRPKNM